MDAQPKLPLSHTRKKSGSEARQKQRVIGLRVSTEYYEKLDAAAGNLTVSAYVRGFLPDDPGVRSRRRPLADVAAVSKLIAELNRIGGNINQIARAFNQGGTPESDMLQEVQALLLQTMKEVRAAMGFGG